MKPTTPFQHIMETAKTEPVEAAIMLVQSTTAHDPRDPFRMPWSKEAAISAAKRFITLTPEQEALVREAVGL